MSYKTTPIEHLLVGSHCRHTVIASYFSADEKSQIVRPFGLGVTYCGNSDFFMFSITFMFS